MNAPCTPAAQETKAAQDGDHPAYRVWLLDPWCRTPWYTAELARGLKSAGHSVRLVSPSYRLERDFFAGQQLRPEPGLLDVASRLPLGDGVFSHAARLMEYGLNAAALISAFRSQPPHILHHQQCVLLERGWQAELKILRAAKARGLPVVHTVHNLLPHSRRPFHRELFGGMYRLCDALVCHDASTADKLCAEFHVQSDRIHVIPHGPLFAEPSPYTAPECRRLLDLPPDRQILLALGVLAPYKGLDVLLSAFQKYLVSGARVGDPLLLIAGSGPETEKAKILSQSKQLIAYGAVRADLRYIPASQIPLYMQAADVLLYPYRDITTSGALLTGLNYCKPIIASDLPPFRPYLIPECNAKVVAPGNVDALASALGELSAPDVYTCLSMGSRENRALQVQWKSIAAQTTSLYQSLVN